MPRRKTNYWTRKLEMELVQFIRDREYVWRPVGNSNHQIQKKYKAYAEFAAKLGWDFTARSVRDRWVNIRSTFNQNLRKVEKSKETAKSEDDVYVPCWPLWKPLQFLRHGGQEAFYETGYSEVPIANESSNQEVKEELPSDLEELGVTIRGRGKQTNRPRKRLKNPGISKCRRVISDLITAMKPLTGMGPQQDKSYWFFGKHVTERLNSMRECDADCAIRDIMKVLQEFLPVQSEVKDEYETLSPFDSGS